MLGKISIYGAGKTGIQTLVYLLKKVQSPIFFYDENTSYVKGISLDAMQSTVLVSSNTYVYVSESQKELEQSNILIICENTENKITINWSTITQNSPIIIIATQDTTTIQQAIQAGIPKEKIIGVHGFADASTLCSSAAKILDISLLDIQAMVFGGIAKDFESKADFVRANGIPINEIKANSYEQALIHTKELLSTSNGTLWNQHYRLSSAAVSITTLLLSGQTTLLPITSNNITTPALVNSSGVIQWFPKLCK